MEGSLAEARKRIAAMESERDRLAAAVTEAEAVDAPMPRLRSALAGKLAAARERRRRGRDAVAGARHRPCRGTQRVGQIEARNALLRATGRRRRGGAGAACRDLGGGSRERQASEAVDGAEQRRRLAEAERLAAAAGCSPASGVAAGTGGAPRRARRPHRQLEISLAQAETARQARRADVAEALQRASDAEAGYRGEAEQAAALAPQAGRCRGRTVAAGKAALAELQAASAKADAATARPSGSGSPQHWPQAETKASGREAAAGRAAELATALETERKAAGEPGSAG